jgi:hypothetical protein
MHNNSQAQPNLFKGAGARQKKLLFELHKQGKIVFIHSSQLWGRGARECRRAKDLLLSNDSTIQEKIDMIEPLVLQLEADAAKQGTKLLGSARAKLNNYYEQLKAMYNEQQ